MSVNIVPSDSERDLKIKENYDVFSQNIDSLISQYGFGKFALLIDKKIVNIFDTQQDAFKAGQAITKGDIFSVQEITKSSINLGIYSCKEMTRVNH